VQLMCAGTGKRGGMRDEVLLGARSRELAVSIPL
jgi:hypothetical protein